MLMYIIINFARNRASIWLEPFTCGLLDFRQLKWSKTPELAFAELFIFFSPRHYEKTSTTKWEPPKKRETRNRLFDRDKTKTSLFRHWSFFLIFRWPNIIWESSKLSRGPLLFKCQIYIVSRFQPPHLVIKWTLQTVTLLFNSPG